MKYLSLFCLGLLLAFQINAQSISSRGQEFWFTYMENLSLIFNGNPQFSVYVYAELSGTATISVPVTGFSFSAPYVGGQVSEITFPPGIFYAEGSEDVENFGFKLTTEHIAQAFTIHYRIYFTEASMLLPVETLDYEYRVMAHLDFDAGFDSPSSFVVVSTVDDNQVEITPTALTTALQGPGVPFTVTLNEGESYQVQGSGDLSGSLVRSLNGGKLVVFGGALKGDAVCSGADNHLFDICHSNEIAGTYYPLVPFQNQGNTQIKVVGLEDETKVDLNGVLLTILNAGEQYSFILTEPGILNSDKSVVVGQVSPSQNCTASNVGDPNLLSLVPSNHKAFKAAVFNPSAFGTFQNLYTDRFVNIVTESSTVNALALNGQNIANQFSAFSFDPSFSYAQVALGAGQHIIESVSGFSAYAYGFGNYDAYTYHLGFEEQASLGFTPAEGQLKIKIWPNPVSNLLSIESESIQITNYPKLFDISGQQIYPVTERISGTKMIIDVSILTEGIYILMMEWDGHSISRKIVVGR